MRLYIDSDILIWHLRGDKNASSFLRKSSHLTGRELWTGAMQRAEIVFFMRENEIDETMQFLSHLKTESVTQSIVDQAASFYRQWAPSHGIDVNDALLAATALETGGVIFTLNKKHFPMKEIAVEKAW